MGANAQTTVPDFVAETVLTAAKLDISAATGVPVFATTVTRDAAFGGANKVLAEGQLAYIEASDTVQYYDGAAWASVGQVSKVVQMVNEQTGAVATGSTSMPYDDTIPQITEGDQYLSLAITPTNASNVLLIEVNGFFALNTGNYLTVGLFVVGTANALAATMNISDAVNRPFQQSFTHKITAGTTSALTFTVRAGLGSGSGTVTRNGAGGSRVFGGVASTSITITEYTP